MVWVLAIATGRVISGEPLAKPPVVSLCCQVGRQVLDKFGPGVSQSQAGGLVEALVARLALGMGTGEASQRIVALHVLLPFK